MSKSIGVIGYGLIGQCIVSMLQAEGFVVRAYDSRQIDGTTQISNEDFDIVVRSHDAIMAATPYMLNKQIADLCYKHRVAYFDLTEDVSVANHIQRLTQDTSHASFMMPQCGLAPGVVSLIAQSLALRFLPNPMCKVRDIEIRVGALPMMANNAMKYYLTWSSNGLINEYCNPCNVVIDGRPATVKPLEGYETLVLDGCEYEAFNTSGGVGSLVQTLAHIAENINYKTIRYKGHRDHVQYLLSDLQFAHDKDALVAHLEATVPHITDDVVVIFVQVIGKDPKTGQLKSEQYTKKIYGQNECSAIQVATAAGACLAVDWWVKGHEGTTNAFNATQDISWDFFCDSPFGEPYL